MKAAAAYDRGLTGKGVIIAVIDTGIDIDGNEFAGRISADSKAFQTNFVRCLTCAPETTRFSLDDVVGHGTRTAAIALAAKDGAGMHGVAYEATLLALKISAPDLTNVTATSSIVEGGAPNIANIAPAIVYAVDKGAFVTSLSLNGSVVGQMAAEQKAAMDHVRANDRLLVSSVSNWIDDDSASEGTIVRNLVGSDLSNKDWFLFGIRVDANLQPPAGNGIPGVLADRTLAVVATDVRTVDENGSPVTVTGNSFAAPAIAGAAALLKQHWPQLGGKEISRILLDTAKDLGETGVDQIYGVGLLDLQNAMTAQAPAASFAAAQSVLARYSSLALSAPFGKAGGLNDILGSMTVFDRYGRDYRMKAPSSSRTRRSGLRAGKMIGSIDPLWREGTAMDARFGFASDTIGPWQDIRPSRPTTVAVSPMAGHSVVLSANVAVGQGTGLAGSSLRAIVGTPVGISSVWVSNGWAASFSSGTTRDGRSSLQSASIDTPLGIGVELSEFNEQGQVLGLRGSGDFNLAGGRTTLATLTAKREMAGVLISARATVAETKMAGGSDLLRFTGPVTGSALSIQGARRLLGGVAAVGLSSPLKVERAHANMLVPLTYDLMSGVLQTEVRSVDLTPAAREIDLEFGWYAMLSSASSLRLGIAHAFDAGHIAGARDTAAFLTFTLR